LRVRKVAADDGREYPFSHRYNEIIVDTGAPQKAGTKLKLRVETEGEIFTGPGGYRDDNYIDLSLIPWFPMPQSVVGNRFTFEITVRTPKRFRPVSSGDTVSLELDGGHYVLSARSEVPVWLLSVFAGKYKTKEVDADGRRVLVHAYAMGREDDMQDLAKLTASFLLMYEKMFGAYPYKELEVVEVPTFSFFGISPPGVVILTTRSFQPSNVVMREYLGNTGVNALVAHELAHQWFGHKAWPEYSLEDGWLNESLSRCA